MFFVPGVRAGLHPLGEVDALVETSTLDAEDGSVLPVQRNDPHPADAVIHVGSSLAGMYLVCHRREGAPTKRPRLGFGYVLHTCVDL